MDIRLGIPVSFRRISSECVAIGAPMLVSANALRANGKFRAVPADMFSGGDVALDSAGFVAMVRYKGYPWSISDYVRLAGSYPWRWYASMDFCCEREVAADREIVLQRVRATAEHLALVRAEADRQAIAWPMPVLQGWQPDDYLRCADLIGDLPALVGLGSVCRRHMHGPDGLYSIINRLDRDLPRHVRLHLFGVKGDAVMALRGHPRIGSIDSMAWDYEARRTKPDRFTLDWRLKCLRGWYGRHEKMLGLPAWSFQLDMAI